MLIQRINNVKNYMKEKHKYHEWDGKDSTCIYCYPISKYRKHKFNRFWDYMQINHGALLIIGNAQGSFSQLLEERRNSSNTKSEIIKNLIRQIIGNITFDTEIINTEKVTNKIL